MLRSEKGRRLSVTETTACTYETIYYTLWELAQRYGEIAQFRVIGKSHDDRMIPMLELGAGDSAVICLSGLRGTERLMPSCLVWMAAEYCQAWECRWNLEDIYDVRQLFSDWKLCFIPVLNPDGYEIYEKDYTVIRNPIYRQMLRMQETPSREYICNARGMDLRRNFPTNYYRRQRISQQPASENETKALIRLFQENSGRGLLSFGDSAKKIVCFRQPRSFSVNQRSYRLARHLQQRASGFHMEKYDLEENRGDISGLSGGGSPERFYAETCRQPAFRIEIPVSVPDEGDEGIVCSFEEYRELYTLPLEYLFSL